jgi:hypothetical protein
MGSADVESMSDNGRAYAHYDHLEQLVPSLSIDPVNLSVCPGSLRVAETLIDDRRDIYIHTYISRQGSGVRKG